MAGIGFALERLFHRDTYSADIGAYIAAGVTLAGGWIFAVGSILVITARSAADLSARDTSLLLTLITYSYLGAMVLTGVLSLPVVRYIADRLYRGDEDSLGPSFASYSILCWIVAFLAGALFFGANPLAPVVKVLAVLLLVACTQVWLATVFISALRTYVYVAASFLVGYLLATVAAIGFGHWYGLAGYLAGFTLGMSVLAMALTVRIQTQFAFPENMNFAYLGLSLRRPALVVVGLSLALGIWVDKLVYWLSPEYGRQLTPLLRYFPAYDMSFFLAYLTVIPLYAHFLLRVETRFARQVRSVYTSLVTGQPYPRVALAKHRLGITLDSIHAGLVLFQAPITLIALLVAPLLLSFAHVPSASVHMFRYAALAAPGVVLLQVQVLYLLYFDLPEAAAGPAAVYLFANLGFSVLTLHVGYWSFGLGHLVAAYLAATLAVWQVRRYLPWLDHEALSNTARASLVPAIRGREEMLQS